MTADPAALAEVLCPDCSHSPFDHHVAGGCTVTTYGPPEDGFMPAEHCPCDYPADDCLLASPQFARLLADAEARAWPCANYLSPLTCLTAPSSEAGRCDWCRGLLADVEAKAEARGRREVREAVEVLHERVPDDSPFNDEGRDVCGTCMDGNYPADWPCPTIAALTTGDPA